LDADNPNGEPATHLCSSKQAAAHQHAPLQFATRQILDVAVENSVEFELVTNEALHVTLVFLGKKPVDGAFNGFWDLSLAVCHSVRRSV
jgi:hypothetical protein